MLARELTLYNRGGSPCRTTHGFRWRRERHRGAGACGRGSTLRPSTTKGKFDTEDAAHSVTSLWVANAQLTIPGYPLSQPLGKPATATSATVRCIDTGCSRAARGGSPIAAVRVPKPRFIEPERMAAFCGHRAVGVMTELRRLSRLGSSARTSCTDRRRIKELTTPCHQRFPAFGSLNPTMLPGHRGAG